MVTIPTIYGDLVNGHFRNLNWRYQPYIFGLCKGISQQNMAKKMVRLRTSINWILKFRSRRLDEKLNLWVVSTGFCSLPPSGKRARSRRIERQGSYGVCDRHQVLAPAGLLVLLTWGGFLKNGGGYQSHHLGFNTRVLVTRVVVHDLGDLGLPPFEETPIWM